MVFPELSVTGYPPRDLVEKPTFVERSGSSWNVWQPRPPRCHLRVDRGLRRAFAFLTGKHATNSAAVLAGGKVVFRQTKMLLPTYDVFDEARYSFPPNRRPAAARRPQNRPHHLRRCLER